MRPRGLVPRPDRDGGRPLERFRALGRRSDTAIALNAKPGAGSFFCPNEATVYLDVAALEAVAEEYGAVAEAALDHRDEAADPDPTDPQQLLADCWSGSGSSSPKSSVS